MNCALDTVQYFLQAGHETTYVLKLFFTISYHRQTYQNYEQPPQRKQNSEIQCQKLM